MYYAHTADQQENWEPLRLHLTRVADRAGSFADAFGSGDEARFTALLHDLGKYSELFHRRLQGDPAARRLDHWSLGAWAANLREAARSALAIQGHHIGLQVGDRDAFCAMDPKELAARHPQGKRLTEENLDLLLQRFHDDGLELPTVPAAGAAFLNQDSLSAMLDTRMLFSTLVDADNLETEKHFRLDQGRAPRLSGPSLNPLRALGVLESSFTELESAARNSGIDEAILRLRADLRGACDEAAQLAPGLFTLTAPTGAGKTLAMLSFALRHAAKHGLRRVVMAIPFLTIIEQTATIYRELFQPVFGSEYVLEHHSLADAPGSETKGDGQEEARRRVRELSQNWDAPLVVTTNVQLLHSLFAQRTQPCRKLHRLAKSVILFDEVQTLPVHLVVPTLATLSHLAQRYETTIVFATATQPAFDRLDEAVRKHCASGWQPREIASPELRFFHRTQRVEVHWNHEQPTPWNELAVQIHKESQALCIVNLKRHAVALMQALQDCGAEDVFHLSTNLCPAHRETVLAEVRRRLREGEPCLLVSTQCVEAGVDVDFPALWRALGPLEAIAQAAGRCNRNGRLAIGIVRVFLPEDAVYPGKSYEQAVDATKKVLRYRGVEAMDLRDPELYREYYRQLYLAADPGELRREIQRAIGERHFVDMAKHYRLIDQDTINVVVPYDAEAYERLKTRLKDDGRLGHEWIRDAGPFTVGIYRPPLRSELWNLLDSVPLTREKTADDWFLYLGDYDHDLGVASSKSDLWIA